LVRDRDRKPGNIKVSADGVVKVLGRQMMAVAVEPGPTFRAGPPRLLFEGDYVQEFDNTGAPNYDVSCAGQRFLLVAPAAETLGETARPRIIVVQYWFEELRRRAPVN
jgi:hypothetical protein